MDSIRSVRPYVYHRCYILVTRQFRNRPSRACQTGTNPESLERAVVFSAGDPVAKIGGMTFAFLLNCNLPVMRM